MPSNQPNVLAGPYIDRAAHRRKDLEWLEQAANDPRSLFVPVWGAQNLLLRSGAGLNAMLLERSDTVFVSLEPRNQSQVFLGIFRDRACFALELGGDDPPTPSIGEFQDIRMILGALPREEAGLLAYARALVSWR